MRTYGEKKDHIVTIRAPKRLVKEVRETGVNLQNEVRKVMAAIVRKHRNKNATP